jgi:RNA polymerase sigma factor (sigma-70 family)
VVTDDAVGMVNESPSHRVADGPLVEAARCGDKEAFAQLIAVHGRSAEGLCRRLLRDPEASRDAVQDATLIAWLSLPRLIHADRFGAWLSGIALNRARQHLRTNLAEARAVANLADDLRPLETPEDIVEAEELRTRIRAAIDGLPPSQRETVYLFYLEGLTYREAAAELDVTVNAVKARLHQARSNLGRTLIALQPKEGPMIASPDQRFVTVRIADVRMSKSDAPPRFGLVLLETTDGEQYLPIFVGTSEASMLALGLENVEMPRPMTYQFAFGLVAACGGRIDEIRITSLVDTTYLATMIVHTPTGPAEVDSRPSDALNLAVLARAPITVESSMLRDGDELREVPNPKQQNRLGGLLDRTEIVLQIRERQEAARQFFGDLLSKAEENQGSEGPT